jgi:hypothetical protein
MLSAALITVSLIVAYAIVVALTALSTFAIVSLKPGLAVEDLRLRTGYNLLQDLFWLSFSALGGYVVTAGTTEASPRLAAALLVVLLLAVIWTNKAEARQRGMIHMLLASACIMAGVAGGYTLRMK